MLTPTPTLTLTPTPTPTNFNCNSPPFLIKIKRRAKNYVVNNENNLALMYLKNVVIDGVLKEDENYFAKQYFANICEESTNKIMVPDTESLSCKKM